MRSRSQTSRTSEESDSVPPAEPLPSVAAHAANEVEALLAAKAVETHGVAGADEMALVGGHAVQRRQHGRPGVGVVAVAVGIVARPEDALHADAMAVVDAVPVGHVREVGVMLHVLARQPR